MKTRPILLTLALCFVSALSFAGNPNMGTWKLNDAKSNFPAGAPRNTLVAYQAVGDKIIVTVDGIDGEGDATHNEWKGQFDGKDYPLTGDPMSDTRSYKVIDDRTLELTNKKNGKVTVSARITVSADGKSRTVTVTTTDGTGKKVEYTEFYDKQ
jgi:hypothetical protein